MKKIFIAFLFIFFDITISFENGGFISLLPTFVGYGFLWSGIEELKEKSISLSRIINITKAELVIASLHFCMNLSGGDSKYLVLFTMGVVLNYYITYKVIDGIKEIGQYHGIDLYAKKLKVAWVFNIVLSILGNIPIIGVFMSVIGFIAYVVLLIIMHKANKRYQREVVDK